MKTVTRRYGENSFIRLAAENIAAPADDISSLQCEGLRREVEGMALQSLEAIPGILFYQLKSENLYVTYMVLCDEVYCYERFDSSWRKMKITPQCLLKAANLITRVA